MRKTAENNVVSRAQDYTTTITILEHLSDAIFILNKNGNIEYANSSAFDMLGVRPEKLLNKKIDAIICEKKREDKLLTDIIEGRVNELETELKTENLSIAVLLNFGVVKNGDGSASYIIASARDIQWRKEMERILNQKQILAISKSRFKEMGELAVNMVHNLSQPLTSLRLKLDLLSKELKSVNLNKSTMESHIIKMGQLLNVINSTIENARRFANDTEDEAIKVINLNENIDYALQQLNYEFTENDIKIVKEYDSDYQVMANPITLQQIFVNLLRLQMHHLSLASVKNARRKITITIKNNKSRWLGIMITAQCDRSENSHIPEVEDFHMQESYELDLKVVKMIAESLGGDFNWYPQARCGFIFSLRIPVDTDDERSQLRNLIELFHDT